MVLTAPQPVLVIMSLSKGNTLAIKRRRSYIEPPDKGGIIQRADKIKGIRLTDQYKRLAFDDDDVCPLESYLILYLRIHLERFNLSK